MTGASSVAGRPWWERGRGLERFVADLLAAELATLRPGAVLPPPSAWTPALHLGTALGADSLERVSLAAALGEALHLHESGVEDGLLMDLSVGHWTEVARRSLGRYSAAITFRTSGSTGAPEACEHSLASLTQEARALAELCPARCRVLAAVPAHHIYGFLWTVLLPGELAVADAVVDVRMLAPSALAATVRAGDLVVAHPAWWRAVSRAAVRFPAGVAGVTSGAPCAPEIIRALRRSGLDVMLEVYGSTQTGGVAWRADPDAPFALMPFWERVPAHAGMLDRVDAGGATVRRELQDAVEWAGPRHLRPVGRLDRAVQVGAVNVYPHRVRELLLTHPAVADAAVRPVELDGTTRLAAFVVPRDQTVDEAALRADLEAWLSARVSPPERPRHFAFGATLPTSSVGKPAAWPVAPSRHASGGATD